MAITSVREVAGTKGAIEGNQTFRRLLWASSISMLGSHVTTIAYPLLVLRLTGSPFTAGCVAFAATAPAILAHMPAGALVDRWNPRHAMLVSEFFRGVAIAAVILTVVLGRAVVPLLIAVAVIEGVLEVFSGLAERRYVGSMVERSQVSSALVRIEARTHVVLVAGRPLGGLLFEINPVLPFAADVLSFVYSVLTLKKIDDHRKLPRQIAEGFREAPSRNSLTNDIKQGLQRIKRDAFARGVIASSSLGTLIFQALIMVFLGEAHSRKLSAFAIGLVLAASGIGGAIGSALAPKIPAAVGRSWIRIQALIWAAGFSAFLLPFGRDFLASAIVMAVLGFSGALGNIALNTHLMQDGNKEVLARVTSISRLAAGSACAIGPVLGGVLVQELGVNSALLYLFFFTPVLILLSFRTPLAPRAQEGTRTGSAIYREEEKQPAGDETIWFPGTSASLSQADLDWDLIPILDLVGAEEFRVTDADVREVRRVLRLDFPCDFLLEFPQSADERVSLADWPAAVPLAPYDRYDWVDGGAGRRVDWFAPRSRRANPSYESVLPVSAEGRLAVESLGLRVVMLAPVIDPDSAVPPYEQVAKMLRDEIAQGAMTGRIPSVHTIAEHHHVSHRVAARALEILQGEGMIENVPGEGHVVRHPRT